MLQMQFFLWNLSHLTEALFRVFSANAKKVISSLFAKNLEG